MKIDLLIKNGLVFQLPGKVFQRLDIAVKGEKIYYLAADLSEAVIADKVIDAEGKYILPGLIDCHMHIESSMTTPEIFSAMALRYGVTTVIADAHEMANVFGLEGLQHFMAAESQMDIFHAIPSSVPSTTPELETTGGIIGLPEVAQLLQDPRVICLGEAMNFKGIAYEPESLIRQIIDLCKRERPTMPLEGHIPKIYGQELADFLASGITSDHTHQFPEHILEKIQAGLFIQFQKKSITPENMAVVREHKLSEYCALITDDVMADEFLSGHLNENLKQAVACGLPLEDAIYMTTYTPARRMGLHDRGNIAPGHLADLIILDELESFSIQQVLKSGQVVFTKGDTPQHPERLATFPASYYQSVDCRPLTVADCRPQIETDLAEVRCHVIRKAEVGTFTEPIVKTIPVVNGGLAYEEAGCSLILVMERYGKNGNIGYGLIEEAITEKGAIATTWAHDHHNLMVMGNDPASMVAAQEKLLEIQGGYVVVKDGKVIAVCELPLGGILSQLPLSELGEQLREVRQGMQALGYKNANEIMSFSTLSLPVSPAIKMTDFGMMDTQQQTFYPLVLPADGVQL